MLLEINNNKTVGALQTEFSNDFPFLKIEFFLKPHGMMEASRGKRVSGRTLIGTLRNRHNSGILEINPLHTAWHIEKQFRDRYGLHIQVYRRTLKGWKQTAGSDLITLKEHNEIGRAAVEDGHSREKKGVPGERILNNRQLYIPC
jgi:hypothetical protein